MARSPVSHIQQPSAKSNNVVLLGDIPWSVIFRPFRAQMGERSEPTATLSPSPTGSGEMSRSDRGGGARGRRDSGG